MVSNSIGTPLTGDKLPPGLKSVTLIVTVAGRQFESSYPAKPNESTLFTRDGLDADGRPLQGAQTVTIKIGYVYAGGYNTIPESPLLNNEL